MGRRERQLSELSTNPRSLPRPELENLARHFGFDVIPGKSSLVKFVHPRYPDLFYFTHFLHGKGRRQVYPKTDVMAVVALIEEALEKEARPK